MACVVCAGSARVSFPIFEYFRAKTGRAMHQKHNENVYFKGQKAGKTSHLERQYPYKWQKTAIHAFKVIHLFSAGVTARTKKVYHF
jgi:hypothetical protein